MIIKTAGSQKESTIVNQNAVSNGMPPMLHYNLDYDTTKPEEVIRSFVAGIKASISRYADNKQRITEIETELVDLEHYIEIEDYKPVPKGYSLYRKMAELRRERRACKNENDMLQSIYDYFHATDVLNKLTAVQGQCSRVKSAVDMRVYTVRTGVLNEFMYPKASSQEEFDLDMDLTIPDVE